MRGNWTIVRATGRCLLAVTAVLLVAGCEVESGTPAPLPDTTGGQDSQIGTDTAGGDADDAQVGVDTIGADGTDSPDVTGDDATTDGLIQDTTPDDVVQVTDGTTGDTTKPDVGPGDIGPDTKPDTSTPKKCTADADCGTTAFSTCLALGCNKTSGACELAPAADGTACTTKGICGGTGVCKQGACAATSACASQPCQPAPVKCGDKLTIDLATLGASKLAKYGCSGIAWDGPEKIVSLAVDATSVVTVGVPEGTTATVAVIALPGAANGACDPGACDKAGSSVTVGMGIGASRVFVLESTAGQTGVVTLTVTCTTPVVCGDGACAAGEQCSSCPKDCGACAGCGDGNCDAATETCGNCAKDCGACVIADECTEKTSPGCAGCACEKCVCDADDYCCKTAWDNLCVSACEDDCGGPKCAVPDVCGNDKCGGTENSSNCPNDCPPAPVCGDGLCSAAGKETCDTCSVDCGFCPGAAPSCGNGKCDAKEHCGSCPTDCGPCAKVCTAQEVPGCPGCACEKCVCDADKFCCETAWDSLCVEACAGKCGGAPCPKVVCGDGLCSATETCKQCAVDCGTCPVVCGDGECTAPSETKTSCAKDCDFASCQGNCGKQAKAEGKASCYCDSYCKDAGDCCPDKMEFCPKD